MGDIPKMEGAEMVEISRQLEQMCSIEDLPKRRNWRDDCLTKLSQLKKTLED